MTIKKENQAQTGKFVNFLPGEVFSYEGEIFMKLVQDEGCHNNAAALDNGETTYFHCDTVVEKVFCTLNVK